MRKNQTWAVAVLAALLLLVAGTSAFATKQNTQPTSTPQQDLASAAGTATEAQISDDPVTLTLKLDRVDGQPLGVRTASLVGQPEAPKASMGMTSAIQQVTDRIKSLATRFLGTPYRWGGTTPKAFDCSGFTRYVYAKMGVKIPRTAREQYKVGKKVPAGTWRTGDLVFFDMRKGYVSHVGMYLGNKTFIHASNPKSGVRIDNLGKGSYRKCYVGARRYSLI